MSEVQPDKIKISCSICGAEYVVLSGLGGKQVRCVKCRAFFTALPPQALPGQDGLDRPAAKIQVKPADQRLKWLDDQMTEIVCPHCLLAYPVSRAFVGQFMACPRCRRKFIVPPHGLAMKHQTLYERFTRDKAAVKVAASAALVLALTVMVSVFLNSSRKSHLLGTMRAVYPAPNYEVRLMDTPPVFFTHKINDGSRECASVAYVHVAHPETGMEFGRMLCLGDDGLWNPTYHQRLLDESAMRFLDDLESERTDYDDYGFNEMVDQIFNTEAANYGEMYDQIPGAVNIIEEEILKRASISAFDRLIQDNEQPGSALPDYSGDEDEDYEYPDFNARYYLAHAVVYPDQAEELLKAGRIKKRP